MPAFVFSRKVFTILEVISILSFSRSAGLGLFGPNPAPKKILIIPQGAKKSIRTFRRLDSRHRAEKKVLAQMT
jgi:hypothetical protein